MARITTTDIDAALKDMAAADGYDGTKLYHTDRLLRSDTAPCEQEQPEVIVTEWVPEPMPRWKLAVLIIIAEIVACVIAGYIGTLI